MNLVDIYRVSASLAYATGTYDHEGHIQDMLNRLRKDPERQNDAYRYACTRFNRQLWKAADAINYPEFRALGNSYTLALIPTPLAENAADVVRCVSEAAAGRVGLSITQQPTRHQ